MKKLFTTLVLLSIIGCSYILLDTGKAFAQVPGYLWANSIGSTGIYDGGQCLCVDKYGNVYIGGTFNGTTDFDTSPDSAIITPSGYANPFFAKYNADGNYIWAKQISTTGTTEMNAVRSITMDTKGNIYICGIYEGTADFDPGTDTATLVAAGTHDIFFAKYDNNGNYLWAKSIGNALDNDGRQIAVDTSGNVYIIGESAGTSDFDPDSVNTFNLTSAGNQNIFFAKYDSLGNFIWAKQINGTGNDNGTSITLDPSGNILITGNYTGTNDFDPDSAGIVNLTSNGLGDIYFAKYDKEGTFIWMKHISSGGDDFGKAITTDTSGNIYLTGYFGGYANFGLIYMQPLGPKAIFTAKYDSSGTMIWARQINSSEDNTEGRSIALDSASNVYISGYFTGSISYGGTNSLTSNGYQDIFYAKYDSAGNCKWANSIGGNLFDVGYGITVFDNCVYLTGFFWSIADFNPGVGTANLTSTGVAGADIFFAKYNQCSHNSEICLVTVDSLSQNNIIIWDKSQFINTSVDSFIIYRDTANGNYAPIGVVPIDSLSFFVDTARSIGGPNGGDPNATSWKYKMAIKDACGNIGAMSPYHKTIYMWNVLGTFGWNHYEIEGQSMPVPALTNYLFQRDNFSTGNFETIQNVSASSTAYTDPQYSTYKDTASWRVQTQWSISCNATKAGGHNSTRSNVQRNYSVSVPLLSGSELNLKISPNPANTKIYIESENDLKDAVIIVYDIHSQILLQMPLKKKITDLDISKLAKGVYVLKIESEEGVAVKRIVKE